ncbi:MAG: four helix bundle protein [Armatimonadota bacterium]
MAVTHFRELRVYQLAFEAAMEIYTLSKVWPKEERWSLTDQIRRSSRSICASVAEAWKKRRYAAHFVSKLSDADSEAAETQAWLDFARQCGYLTETEHGRLNEKYQIISGGLVKMMAEPEKWCFQADRIREPPTAYLIDDGSTEVDGDE